MARSHPLWLAVAVPLATALAIVVVWPVGAGPFNDDPSYAQTARVLADTGHLTYNGWATAASVSHAAWGAAWVRAFGFSFGVLRLSTLPLAVAAVAVAHALARRAGLRPAFAALAALTLGLSPLFLPLATSYMTDVPGLCFTLAALYAAVRAAESPRAAAGWLAACVAVGVVGGTGRQIVWAVPLAVVPYVAWVRRTDRAVVVAAAVGWGLTVAAAALTMAWFARQPYALAEPPVTADLRAAALAPAAFAGRVLAIGPTLAVLVLPAAVGLARGWRRGPAVAAIGLSATAVAALLARRSALAGPWMHNTLTTRGVLGIALVAGDRPLTLGPRACLLLSAVTFVALAAAAVRAVEWAVRRPRFATPVVPILIAFAVAHVALLLPRCGRPDATFDRYVLPLVPCAAIVLLSTEQARRPRPGVVAWGLLVVWAGYAVGTTQDLLATGRAREAAAARLAAAGVPMTSVTGGFDFDLWTQLQADGHANSSRLTNPPGAYRPGLGLTPAIRPTYRLELTPSPRTEPTPLGSVPFRTLLPPFRRRVYVDRFREAWWLDPARAATRPSDGWR